MIDAMMSDALNRIAMRAQDVQHAYQGGFEPQARDVVASSPQVEPSMDGLSVVAPDGGYFVTADAAGAPLYTRAGGFSLNDGVLRMQDGSPILGFSKQGGSLEQLRLDRVDRALGRVSDARIEADGSVCYTRASIDPRTGSRHSERVSIGRIALARFPLGTAPIRMDSMHVQAPRGVVPHVGSPGDGAFPALLTHARDAGRLDMLGGLARLQEAYLSFEALQAARNANDGVAKTTMGLLK
jgi:flagellar basal body rod protein FlgG